MIFDSIIYEIHKRNQGRHDQLEKEFVFLQKVEWNFDKYEQSNP